MVGKLLKHEFRATARIMLLVYAALAAVAILFNLSFRFTEIDNVFLQILFAVMTTLFVIGVIAAAVITAVVMIGRFYRSLLKEQGYLMHTLPVSVHGHIWSKLIVSFVWFVATFILICLLMMLTFLIQSGTDLGEMFAGFPSWSEIQGMLKEAGVTTGSITFLGIEAVFCMIVGCLAICLHFYAAMSLGHMFSKNKILLSIVFYIGINIVFSIISTCAMSVIFQNEHVVNAMTDASTFAEVIRLMKQMWGGMLLAELVEGAVLYLATYFPLKKGLNLA